MLEVPYVNLPCSESTCTAFVEAKLDSNDLGTTGARLCCNGAPLRYASGNRAVVRHRTDSYTQSGWRGWTIKYKYCRGAPACLSLITYIQMAPRLPLLHLGRHNVRPQAQLLHGLHGHRAPPHAACAARKNAIGIVRIL